MDSLKQDWVPFLQRGQPLAKWDRFAAEALDGRVPFTETGSSRDGKEKAGRCRSALRRGCSSHNPELPQDTKGRRCTEQGEEPLVSLPSH